MTYNVLHGGVPSGWTGDDDDLEARLAVATEDLRALDADVIGLQEASTGPRRGNVAARIAAALGMHFTYAPASFRISPWEPFNGFVGWLMRLTEGPAILSRWPIARAEAIDLPRCGGLFDVRTLAYAELATPWGALPAFSTHLSWGGCQAHDVAAIVRERRGELPGLLFGDFNADSASPAIAAMVHDADLVDAFRAARPDARGRTVWQDPTTGERTVTRRVDFVFAAPGERSRFAVEASRIVLDEPRTRADGHALWPSDHYGVLARVRLVRSTRRATAASHR